MFDPNKPYNDLPDLPIQVDVESIKILKLLNQSNIALGGLATSSVLMPFSHLLYIPLTVKEAVQSNEIESIRTTVEEAFQSELFPENTGHSKEAINYRDALLHGFELIKKYEFLSVNHILEIQAILEPTKKGVRKIPGTKIVSGYGDRAKVIYTPPEGYDLLIAKLSNFEKYFNEEVDIIDGLDPLIRMAILHYQFEAIHPFLDGNGRTGRILNILYLILHNRLHVPVLYLSEYILSNKNKYYDLLNKISTDKHWEQWVEFILKGVGIKSYETKITIMEIKSLEIKIKDKIQENHSNIYSHGVMEYMFSRPFYTIDSMVEKVGIHRITATKYLNEMTSSKILIKKKLGRRNYFYNQDFLKLLS